VRYARDTSKSWGMPGNITKAQALEWLSKNGTSVRGYRQEVAAAYLGIGVRRFRKDVAAGLLTNPEKHGKRLVWDKIALDSHRDRRLPARSPNITVGILERQNG
jgi:hypothetical protein